MLLARVLIVLSLIPNGIRKIASFEQTAAMMGGAPPTTIDGRLFPAQEPLFYFPFPEVFLAFSLSFDIVGALLVIVGFWLRPAAGFLAVYCVLAMSIYHSDITGGQDVMAILRNLPLVGGLLLLACTGGGSLSLDASLRYRRSGSA